jgi:hypothetical protein
MISGKWNIIIGTSHLPLAHRGNKRCKYNFDRKHIRKQSLGRPRRWWKHNIKINVTMETGVNWLKITHSSGLCFSGVKSSGSIT